MQVFSCDLCGISKNTFLYSRTPVSASVFNFLRKAFCDYVTHDQFEAKSSFHENVVNSSSYAMFTFIYISIVFILLVDKVMYR